MFLLTLTKFETKIKEVEVHPCEKWCTEISCDGIATKKVLVKNCGCKKGEFWLCDQCQSDMSHEF